MYIEIYRFENKNKIIRIAVIGGELVIISNDIFTKEGVVVDIPLEEVTNFGNALLKAWELSKQEKENYQTMLKNLQGRKGL